MEVQTSSSRLNQTSYISGLLSNKAENSIKRHRVRGFVNEGSSLCDTNFGENDENSQLAQHLLHLKNSQIKHKQLEQYKYKDQTTFILEKVKAIQGQKFEVEAGIEKMKTIAEEVQGKKVNAIFSSKTYEHILNRMKMDQIKHQIRRNQLQKQLKTMQKKFKDLHNKNNQLRQYEFLSTSGVKQAQEEIMGLNNFRKETITNMSGIMDEKQVLQKKKQERKQKSDMIKEMAAGDLQDADLIRMKKYLTAQLFANALLKGKMEKLKNVYQPYELAFLKIKMNTNVKDASSLKSQFQNFESSFTQMTCWVKHLEDQVTRFQQQNKLVEQQYSQLKQKEMELLESMEQEEQKIDHVYVKQLQTKANNCQAMTTSVNQWLIMQCKRLAIECQNVSNQKMLGLICEQLKKKNIQAKTQKA